MNQINTILPYRIMGGWAFDDDAVGLEREPFVAGADKAIDKIVEHLGIETDKIKMTFSKDKFPGHHVKLLYLAPDTIAVWDGGGDFYRIEDDNFNIDGIPKVPDSVARSAVALKADDIRLLARETIKLCTAMDPLNSQNGSIQSVGGIYLIAGSAGEEGDQVQSIARGENTASAIDALIIEVLALKNAFHGFVEKQSEFNSNVASHTHHSPFFGKPTLPSQVLTIKGPKTAAYHWEKTINSLVALSNNIAVVQDNYLQKNGPHYVGSRHNKTN